MRTLRYLAGVAKPEYLLRPHQVGRRLWRALIHGRKGERRTVRLPWGLDIAVDPSESIGWSIYSRAVYETAVTEALWRLAQPGDTAVDGGANVGYMTSVLAAAIGERGKIYCFEPHPGIFRRLQANVSRWKASGRCGSFALYEAALGDREAVGTLRVPDDFPQNQGTSRIEVAGRTREGQAVPVKVLALDDVIPSDERLAVIKLDVEGGELAALKGMKRILAGRRVGHVVFEEQGEYPAATHWFLKEMGYHCFGLEHGFLGLRCAVQRRPCYDPVTGPPPSYVATLDPEFTVSRLERGFWESFGPARLLHK